MPSVRFLPASRRPDTITESQVCMTMNTHCYQTFAQTYQTAALLLLLAVPLAQTLSAQDVPPSTPGEAAPSEDALATAITLNYCRASFHRIRKTPTDEVLHEEQEKILNNLSLTQLNDPEIIKLYTAVLDEIGDSGLDDREKELRTKYHRTTMTRKVTWDAVAFTTDLATAQFGSAIRNGANSWWDYRSMEYQRDSDLLKVDRARVNAVVEKSSQFLDTGWRMAQKKQIPDRWLVRGSDLDALEAATQEKDPEVRLRVLRRMEPFMEAYPPYWYYVGRTQQQLGQLPDAIATYERLEAMGKGHFRKDDMLATAMANGAALVEATDPAQALAMAESALVYSTDVWEANLICARILERQGQIASAEDAILRNLDVDIETVQSRVFLASLYYHSEETDKLAKMLHDPVAVAELPAPVLLRCAARLGVDRTPATVLATIMNSLEAQPRLVFGPDELHVRAAASWQLHLAQLRAYRGDEQFDRPLVAQRGPWIDMRFASRQDWGNPLNSTPSNMQVRLEFEYPDHTVIHVALSEQSRPQTFRTPLTASINTPATLRISDLRVGEDRIALNPNSWEGGQQHINTARPVSMLPLPQEAPEVLQAKSEPETNEVIAEIPGAITQ